MKKFYQFFVIFLCFSFWDCSNNDEPIYTVSELEMFLIQDSKKAVYVFPDEGYYYTFDFSKASKGNKGEYHRDDFYEFESYVDYNFTWEVIPSGNGGIVIMKFDKMNKQIKVKMGLMEQHYYSSIGEISFSEKLWKLDFTLKDDPFI